jgi:hypothetical protein
MPVHDWTQVDAGIFHAFHHDWITEISRALNRGLLPTDYYALPEQIAGGRGPDVLTLQRPANGTPALGDPIGGVALAAAPPRVNMRLRSEPDMYAAKAKAVVIRHTSGHRVIAVLEVVSPGNKNTRHGVHSFVSKAVDMLRAGIHLLIIDLFPPGPRDPEGIHKLIWDELIDNDFTLPSDRRLTIASYNAGTYPEAFLEFAAVHLLLVEMPLFLSPDVYVLVPLEQTYQSAFDGLPLYWRDVLKAGSTGNG